MHFLLFIFLTLVPWNVFAAEFRVTPPLGAVQVGDTFTVEVVLDPEGEAVNALEGGVEVSPELRITEVRYARSVVPLWVVAPSVGVGGSQTLFAGAIPGGFEGVVGTSWVGFRPGTVLTLVVTAVREGDASVSFTPRTLSYLHDGEGTPAETTLVRTSFTIGEVQNTAQSVVQPIDAVPPEPFTPELFDGALFRFQNAALVFGTVDKQTAVERYEIALSDTEKDERALSWKVVESPYEVTFFDRLKYIYVRAIDRAGNTQVAVVPPAEDVPRSLAFDFLFFLSILGAMFWLLWRYTVTTKKL